jgi:hypothetical protein
VQAAPKRRERFVRGDSVVPRSRASNDVVHALAVEAVFSGFFNAELQQPDLEKLRSVTVRALCGWGARDLLVGWCTLTLLACPHPPFSCSELYGHHGEQRVELADQWLASRFFTHTQLDQYAREAVERSVTGSIAPPLPLMPLTPPSPDSWCLGLLAPHSTTLRPEDVDERFLSLPLPYLDEPPDEEPPLRTLLISSQHTPCTHASLESL